ncbi:hypothetical protein Hamer_G001257 [Homarus americanus]|uniref:Kazal-like domain-containing protein n=1 Tax=Homarus americanus TaxID=6706 RepID=A0A8J5TIQ5_HOMAM|nr:hypothetical protein Hamer_G001257 [Homarus americanus]
MGKDVSEIIQGAPIVCVHPLERDVHSSPQVPPSVSIVSVYLDEPHLLLYLTATQESKTVLHASTGLVVVGLAMHIYEGDGCLDYCPKSVNYNPVCGTNYVTYINPTYLLCQKKCGEPKTSGREPGEGEMELDRQSLDEWAKDKPLSILQLDPADRAVLKIAGKK